MSVTLRKYQGGDRWEMDIRVPLPDGTVIRERKLAPVPGKAAAQAWASRRERELLVHGKPKPTREREVPAPVTLKEFAPRFMEGHVKAERQKPSGIAAKEAILRVHLIPMLGRKPLGGITTEDVQRLKSALERKAPKTINNVLTVLKVTLRKAVAWGVIDSVPCEIRLLRIPRGSAKFYDFADYERLLGLAKTDGWVTELIVLLGGEAGLRCGEMMALEWTDVDLGRRQLSVARSDWHGHVTATKGGRVRYVPLTERLRDALKRARHLRSPRVLCDQEGKPLTQKVVQVAVRRVALRARVKPGVHILRHTFCSHLAMRGAPARAIQELAGHQDLATTQRYMHVSPAALEAAVRLLDGSRATARGEIEEAAGNQPQIG